MRIQNRTVGALVSLAMTMVISMTPHLSGVSGRPDRLSLPREQSAGTQAVKDRNDLGDVNVPNSVQGFEQLIGEVTQGRQLVENRPSCADCHAVNAGEEGDSPKLFGVADRLTLKQLVTSILEPSRDIAPGYQYLTINTVDGETLSRQANLSP